jgi:hypothetical protein
MIYNIEAFWSQYLYESLKFEYPCPVDGDEKFSYRRQAVICYF